MHVITPNLKEAQKRTKEKVHKITFEFDSSLKNLGKGKTYFVKTYGCQMNEHDSENIRALLEEMSFKPSLVLESIWLSR